MKSFENRDNFIEELSKMTPNEINDFIKKYGKPPKPVNMCVIVSKDRNNDNSE